MAQKNTALLPYIDGYLAGVEKISADRTVAHEIFESARSRVLSPEMSLLARVLEDAVETLKKDRVERQLYRETVRWFVSDKTDRVFTFVSICAALHLDAAAFRRKLNQMLKDLGKEELRYPAKVQIEEQRKAS